MTYYGISVIITILVTSMIAFYLLYKAKELNLGILISITSGSIVLGFSFSPAFKFIMELLSESVNLDKKVALILSLIAELLIFLFFICILSLVISIVIPKKFSSIDCGIYIDKFFESIKNTTSNIFKKMSAIAEKTITLLKENVKNTYNLKNKLKKPVDTNQIIDTMGLEKNENGVTTQGTSDSFANLIAFIEPDRQEASDRTEAIHTSEEIQAADTVAAAVETDVVDIFDVSADNEHIPIGFEGAETESTEPSEEPEAESAELSEEPETENAELSEVSETEFETENYGIAYAPETETEGLSVEFEPHNEEKSVEHRSYGEVDVIEAQTAEIFDIADEKQLDADVIPKVHMEIDKIEDTNGMTEDDISNTEANVQSLVVKAFEYKDKGRRAEAVEYYMKALQHNPDKEMLFWIVLDVCALYKQLGLASLAQSILEGIVEEYEAVIKPEIKEEIIKNLK